ncbi:MAG: response regulator transcription factor [Campylobacteraceae bacterium]|jgi:DNA-binding response OmpR family regulator|nr:response regulator transcription factor [Campylobacteraceae bacterium]
MHKSTLKLLNNFSALIVEDDELARNMLKQGLKDYFGSLYEAKDGLEGFETFKKNRIDIIITDIQLPHLSGFEMIQEIQKLKPKQLFVVITSYGTDQNILKSIQNGAVSFLHKPIIDIQDLQTTLLFALAPKVEQPHTDIGGGITVDFNREIIYKDAEALFLSQLNNKIFWLLCYNLNMLVTYEMIEDYIYDGESVNKSAIQMSVLRIKKQLGINIENVINSGYILKKSTDNL